MTQTELDKISEIYVENHAEFLRACEDNDMEDINRYRLNKRTIRKCANALLSTEDWDAFYAFTVKVDVNWAGD
ncbi:MAG: hypothetical protein WC936_03605 [Candidatus Nanoarchaeia archaeon]|jgi:hypothetical protein